MNSLEKHTQNIKTMSSREIANLTGKRHDNVMRDIEEMLENLEVSHLKSEAADFESKYKDVQGKSRKCYHLPKRETLILVSGYDVNLRAKIIDRWAELEAEKRQQITVQKTPSATTIMKLHKHLEELAKQAGLKENQLLLKVNQGVAGITGVNQLGAMGIEHLPSPDNDEYLTPTKIGLKLDPPLNPVDVNRLLTDLGLQVRKADKQKGYMPTPHGDQLGARMMDVSKVHTGGSVQQLKWHPRIVPYLQKEIKERENDHA
ncbi:Rha family transcriptional regulator [Candidatus Liberibacter sp.]|uniref:Rha family transcriptional regulator n=1 Tax=Candidatus Liberibacter sp. TaxID=34022 RepID=UPI0015F743AB|nr:Rha family transcriptional regulator [Candidatus Liberibacter sp.]MBA5724606.1 Rha family transcriptional regulator [Candidatus Liberibacter sp.]